MRHELLIRRMISHFQKDNIFFVSSVRLSVILLAVNDTQKMATEYYSNIMFA